MKPVESSGISTRIEGANGSIEPHQESNMKTLHAFRTAGALGVLAVTQIALVSGANAQSTAVQWRVEDGGNGHWYELIVVPGSGYPRLTWTASESLAEAAGGYLATITTTDENAFVFNAFASAMASQWSCWIGGLRLNGGGLAWVTGEYFSCASLPFGNSCPFGGESHLYTGQYGPGPYFYIDDHNDEFQGGKNESLVEWSADCNADNIVDYGQCLDGSLPDTNANNIPDCCEEGIPCSACYAYDLNPTGIVDGADLGALLAFWGPVSPAFPRADINRDGNVNGADLGLLLANWGPCGQ
jgi:hypothetical protein